MKSSEFYSNPEYSFTGNSEQAAIFHLLSLSSYDMASDEDIEAVNDALNMSDSLLDEKPWMSQIAGLLVMAKILKSKDFYKSYTKQEVKDIQATIPQVLAKFKFKDRGLEILVKNEFEFLAKSDAPSAETLNELFNL